MKSLFEHWPAVEPLLKERVVMLFLDYDGTLTPIVDDPARARLSAAGKKALHEISKTGGIITSVVSGRALADVKKLAGVPGLIYAGNHGLELEGPAIRFTHPQAVSAKNLMAKLRVRLKQALRSFTGILVEDKTFTLSVHYRRLAKAKVERARDIFLKTVRPYVRSEKVTLTSGKKVWEVRPVAHWNKGTTVLWLYGRVLAQSEEERILPVYVGDDRTDEDAFRSLKPMGMSVKVRGEGPAESDADYYLESPREVLQFLKRLQALKSQPVPPQGVKVYARR